MIGEEDPRAGDEPVDAQTTDPSPRYTATGHEQTVEQRPHWATPLVNGWIVLVTALIVMGRDVVRDLDAAEGFDPGSLSVIGIIVAAIVVIQIGLGYFQWRTTRFRIDEEEVRIDRRFIQHQSDRLALGKIQSVDIEQPFAARLLGLAKLTIDVGAGEHKTIEFLTRRDAYRFRDLLVQLAPGPSTDPLQSGQEQTDLAETAPGEVPPASGSAWRDRRVDERTITVVTPRQVIVGTFASLAFIVTVLAVATSVVASAVTGEHVIGLAAILGAVVPVCGYVWNSLTENWRFTLLRSGTSLKAVHGMTSLTTRTVPVQRVQGIAISQPFLWRAMGLHRVRLTVLGSGPFGGDEESTTLLPMGDGEQVRAAVDALWPGFDIDMVPLNPIPRRARWFRWFDQPVLRWGWDNDVIMARSGLLTRTTSIVPHARVQSVEVDQGPLQRRLDLADVGIEIPAGPVDLVCRHMDATDARALVLTELDRCRASRAAEMSTTGSAFTMGPGGDEQVG